MNRLLKWLLLLGFFLGVAQLLDTSTPPTPVLAETRAAPAPQYPQSDPGSYGYIPLVNVLWVSNTGLTAQPADTAVVYGANTRVTVPMTAVNQNGWFIFTGNKISSVSVNEYVNGSWQAVNVGTSISHSEPTSSADVTLPAGLSVGTHYYQATVHYPTMFAIRGCLRSMWRHKRCQQRPSHFRPSIQVSCGVKARRSKRR
ncbi:hypothetical protein [Lacticaseibacillus saniviri]|uniref:hypothetical protein n=1 Tax=Lacticaseibacillus saniviri TaxID=931533 RepID=UPI0006D0B7B4|nr:hypothetical protein [Lacticaseibacillus saniviri]